VTSLCARRLRCRKAWVVRPLWLMDHALDMYSAYGGGRGVVSEEETKAHTVSKHGVHEPPFTTWKFRPNKEAKHTIDYIFFKRKGAQQQPTPVESEAELAAHHWYNQKRVIVRALLDIPTEQQIGQLGLPARQLASDHVNIMAAFSLL
jgi:mRNA deadenylase 3'-5' endonuclease subunit Ccr4